MDEFTKFKIKPQAQKYQNMKNRFIIS